MGFEFGLKTRPMLLAIEGGRLQPTLDISFKVMPKDSLRGLNCRFHRGKKFIGCVDMPKVGVIIVARVSS